MHKEKLATSKQQSLSSYFSHLGQKYRTENMVSGHLTLEHSILSSGVAAPTVAGGEIFVSNPEPHVLNRNARDGANSRL